MESQLYSEEEGEEEQLYVAWLVALATVSLHFTTIL